MVSNDAIWNPKVETMPVKELKELQLKRLRWVVDHAYKNNRVYHDNFKSAGLKPGDIKTLDDLSKIPFLTKADLRNSYPFGMVCVPMDKVIEIHASSGTTGKPVVGTYTKNDLGVWSEVMARAIRANNLKAGDRMHNAYGYGLFTGAHGFERGAQTAGVTVFPLSSGNTKRQITMMKDLGSTGLACTPSYSLYLAEAAQEMGLDPQTDLSIKSGLFGAESWGEELRKTINKVWDMEAFDHYGLTEVIGPGVSVECGQHDGLHINADHFLPEIIDSKTGERLEPGEKGELVFTSLTKEAFPSIRFRTKDISILYEDECECGRTSPRHARLMGRSDDMMKVKGVIVFPKQIEEAVMSVRGVSENYQIVKFKKGVITNLAVRVEPTSSRHKEGGLDALKKQIEDEIFAMLNLRIPATIVAPGSIPRSEGKAKRVVEE